MRIGRAGQSGRHEYGVDLVAWEHLPRANAIVAAVSHKQFLARPIEQVLAKLAPHGLYVDVKSAADKAALESRGVNVWRL